MPTPEGNAPDPGRSRERRDQDRLLDRTAAEEPWLTRLWRHRFWAKGRPDPGNRGDKRQR